MTSGQPEFESPLVKEEVKVPMNKRVLKKKSIGEMLFGKEPLGMTSDDMIKKRTEEVTREFNEQNSRDSFEKNYS